MRKDGDRLHFRKLGLYSVNERIDKLQDSRLNSRSPLYASLGLKGDPDLPGHISPATR
jgi:hypothetical protein